MIYILHGSDSFSRSERLRALKQELDAGSLETNTVEFDAREVTPAEVIAACNTVPFLGNHRLVVLEGALGQGSSPGGGRRRRKQVAASETAERGPWWQLAALAEDLPETSILVLVDGDSVDTELLSALKPFASVETFPLPLGRDVAAWVQRRARERGLQIEGRACSVIADMIGNDTWMLASEIDKLAVYASGGRITEHEVKALVPDVRDHAGYELSDAIADGKAARATSLLHEMLASGKHHPGALLATIENRYRRMAVAREMLDEGETGTRIGARLGMSGFGLDRLLEQTSRLPMEAVRWALDRIAQSDQDVKEGIYDNDKLALELLVHELAAPAALEAKSQRVSAAAGSSW